MKTAIRISLVVSGLTLFTMPLFSQGLYWEGTISGPMFQGKEIAAKTYYIPKLLKQVHGDSGEVTIMRLDKEVIITVNKKDSTYSEMTFAEMEAEMKNAGGQMDEKMAEAEKEMEDLPPEQKKMVEEMMAKMGKKKDESNIEVTETGGKKTISGYSCTEYVATEDGKSFLTVWTTNDIKGFEPLADDLMELLRRMAEMIPMMGRSRAEAMKKVKGFPILTEAQQVKTLVTNVEKRSTPASEFEVPEGYKLLKK
jgi:hypothetical protein